MEFYLHLIGPFTPMKDNNVRVDEAINFVLGEFSFIHYAIWYLFSCSMHSFLPDNPIGILSSIQFHSANN